MKRIYWLLIAAVPVVLWWLSQGGSHQEAQSAPPKPEPEKPPATPDNAPESSKDLPTSSNGTFPKAPPATPPAAAEASPPAEAPAAEAPAPAAAEAPAPAAAEAIPVATAAAPEKIQEAAETAPPLAPQIEAPATTVVEGEPIQVFDSKDRALDCQLIDITGATALVRCPEVLPEKEKARLVLPFGDEAITVNGQLQSVEDGVSRFKIMTMKAGQKKRFEDYLSQRMGL